VSEEISPKFLESQFQAHQGFLNLIIKAFGSLSDSKPLKTYLPTEEKVDKIGVRLEYSPWQSPRCITKGTGISNALAEK
jgi:hypothetical protein